MARLSSTEAVMTQEILPPEPPEPLPPNPHRPDPVVISDELPDALEFDPVPPGGKPRGKSRRTAQAVFDCTRQRQFIGALAACGSVTTAAAAVRMSVGQVYHTRQRKGAESFAAAWDKAVAQGARRVLDVLVDQAINGTPEYVYKDGELVGERRHFNTRTMMWIVAHYMPERFGVAGGLMHASGAPLNVKRLRDRWRQEWLQERIEAERARSEGAIDSIATKINAIRSGFKRAIARDPAKRAAWELLTGPTDWGDPDKLPNYWGETPTNQNRPDIIVANAMGMDAIFGMRSIDAGEEDGAEDAGDPHN
jgi:hypothetical protein